MHTCPVQFSFKAAYRKDYEWGRFFREQWNDGDGDWKDGGSCFLESSCSATNSNVPPNPVYQTFDNTGTDYTGYQLRLAVRAQPLGTQPCGWFLAPGVTRSSFPASVCSAGGLCSPPG